MIPTALRTAGIWIEDSYVLLESLAAAEVWGIPGGRIRSVARKPIPVCQPEHAELGNAAMAMPIAKIACVV